MVQTVARMVLAMTGYNEANEARKRLRVRSDLELWHKFVGLLQSVYGRIERMKIGRRHVYASHCGIEQEIGVVT